MQAAISQKSGTLTLHKVVMHGHYRANGTAIASTNKEQVRREAQRNIGFIRGSLARIATEQVQAMPLVTLLEKNMLDPEAIDFFACDTEGLDTEIVGQLLSTGAKPDLIQYEHLHASREEVDKIDRRLRLGKYTLIKTHKDTFAYR